MLPEAILQKTDPVDDIVEYARQRMNGASDPARIMFIRKFYERAAPTDLLERSVENLYGAALSMRKFLQSRDPHQPNVRVFHPTLEAHGWQTHRTVIEIVTDDMPFLVDSITGELTRLDREIRLLVHPVLHVRRDQEGQFEGLVDPRPGDGGQQSAAQGEVAESVMHIEIDELTAPEILREIEERLNVVLADVRAAVEDWPGILVRLRETIEDLRKNPPPVDQEEGEEAIAFLEWLEDNNFTFLGFREYAFQSGRENLDLRPLNETGCGLMRQPDNHVLKDAEGFGPLSPEVKAFLESPVPLMVTKANVRTTVHRPVHLDYIGVKRFDSAGNPIGERRFVGLFTSTAYNRNPRSIPFLRRKVSQTVERAGFAPNGHAGKALLNVLETFPRDELFQIDLDELYHIAIGIMHLQERPRPKAFLRQDRFERFVAALVYLPRSLYDTRLRERIEKILCEAYNGRISAQYSLVGDSALARLLLIIKTTPGAVPQPDPAEIDRKIEQASRNWQDDLKHALIAKHGEEAGIRLATCYCRAFPTSYREAFSPETALGDTDRIEQLDRSGEVLFNIYRRIEDSENTIRLKLYHGSELIPLSDCLPMLEHAGLKVIEEQAYDIHPENDTGKRWVHDFYMQDPSGPVLDLDGLKPRLEEAFARVWAGDMDDDSFNGLVVRAGLGWRDVVVLRSYGKYLRQIGISFSEPYMQQTLNNNPEIACLLVRSFEALFDPDNGLEEGRREELAANLASEVEEALAAVESLDEDRILRRFLNMIGATLRTNFYQVGVNGEPKPYVSLKLDCAAIEDLPLPRPHAEIFVYSPRFEGVHLRGGKVARGGLRWSDRREDYRTEILGLMKAQMVKNAVIVPVGAKGGFVPKNLPLLGSREDVLAEGVACYRAFISGLLDITDNLVDGAVVAPEHVIRRDDDDPYLVVAADKGTATFSDIANEIAQSYGFWLDDAFASGGSVGYDHKKMAITARGAWVSVQRLFREMDIDIQNQPISVIGIGDMSGDVFGNGMLRSKQIKLIAAFDHRNIFIDPTPDLETNFAERQRLYDLPRSSWMDYDSALISEGGGIFDRKAKSVALTPQIKDLLGVNDATLTPNELINALLRVEADLLWIGGIGTYIKAHDESHADAGDRANDALRVDARDLKFRVIGEGGNLGITQAGRIEFAQNHGRINTDAVDNAGGVNCSDLEVNIKIFLNRLIADGELTRKHRNQLLEEMTDEVAELVLRSNYVQTQALSVAEAESVRNIEIHGRYIKSLERAGRLDRSLERLPSEEEIGERAAEHAGLTRPELAVLLAYAKMTLYEDLLVSPVLDEPYLEAELLKAFPASLTQRYAETLHQHRLHREIIATELANDIVNRAGPTFVFQLQEESGEGVDDIVRAYVLARDVFDFNALGREIEQFDYKIPASIQTQMLIATMELHSRQALWFLTNLKKPIDLVAASRDYAAGVTELRTETSDVLLAYEGETLRQTAQTYLDNGVPEVLARKIANLEPLAAACDIVFVANALGRSVTEVARAHYVLGDRLGLDWLRAAAENIITEDHWDRLAIGAIVDDLFDQQRAMTSRVLAQVNGQSALEAVENWIDSQDKAMARSQQLIADFKASGIVTVAKLGFASRQLRGLLLH